MRNQNRLDRQVLNEDLEAYRALLAIRDYEPQIAAFNLTEATAARDALEAMQTERVQKEAASDAAKDAEAAAERTFHELMLGVKDQIKAQFGANSDEYASLGLKKKSEYRRPRRDAAKTPPTPI